MDDQEFQPFIIELERKMKEALPKTCKIMFNCTAILKECSWPEYMMDDYFIFKENIFQNKTEEAKIIWAEIKLNLLTHTEQMINNPVKWTLKNRFWLNSAYACKKLGLEIHKDHEKYDQKGKTFSKLIYLKNLSFAKIQK